MRRFFSILFICCSPFFALAQGDDYAQVLSPTAAELGKYGKIPVSYFNGLPNVSVPLTELRAKDYTLPIYLTYHAGGNKPEQHPGWVGQGWALHAGGCISRIVRGEKDEKTIDEYRSEINGYGVQSHPGYLFHATEAQSKDWTNIDTLAQVVLSSKVVPNGYIDFEPDEFLVNVEGIQASFFFVGPNQIKIESQTDTHFSASMELATGWQNRDVILSLNQEEEAIVPLYDYIKTICLTKDDGTKYTFGGVFDAIEFSFQHYVDTDIWYWKSCANTWHLTSIEKPDGERITFEYVRRGMPIVKVDSHYDYVLDYRVPPEFARPDFDYLYSSSLRGDSSQRNLHYSILYPSYLSRISSHLARDEITFHTSPTEELDYSVTANQMHDRVCVPWSLIDTLLTHDYYHELDRIDTHRGTIALNYTRSLNTRLKLTDVNMIDDEDTVWRYTMTYNPEPLPPYNSRKTDAWGYYSRSTPYSGTAYATMNTVRRQINAQLMQAEMLTRLTYPTGGYTDFEYEPHTFSSVANSFPFGIVSEEGMAGGLRIKRMTDHLRSGPSETRCFSYLSNGLSSGILAGYPSFYETGVHTLDMYRATVFPFFAHEQFDAAYSLFSEQTLVQLPLTRGNHVTYSIVTEERPGAGRTEYRYYNHNSESIPCQDHGPVVAATNMTDETDNMAAILPICSYELNRGLLKSKKDYDKNDRLVRFETNEYSVDTTCFVKAVARFVLFDQLVRASFYKHYTYFPALRSKVVTTYPDNGNPVIPEEYFYEYDENRNVTSVVKRVLGYGIDETRTVYSGDTTLCTPGSVYAQMKAAGILDRPVETLHLRDNRVIEGELTTYRCENNLFLPDKSYKTSLEAPLNPSLWAFYTPGTIPEAYGAPRRHYRTYDSHGNPTSVLDGATEGAQIAWDANGVHPVAVFNGAGPRLEVTPAIGYDSSERNLRALSGRCLLLPFEAEETGTASLSAVFDEGEALSCYVKIDTAAAYYHFIPLANPPAGFHDVLTYVAENVSPGHHVFQIALSPADFATEIPEIIPLPPGGTKYFQADAIISYPVLSHTEGEVSHPVFYEDFESAGNVSYDAFESNRSHTGGYIVQQTIPPLIPYKIDWMEKGNGSWTYQSDFFTGVKTLGAASSLIDNIRIYPVGAEARNWTWWPTGELRSETDERGQTVRYRYDGLGRLMFVLDKDSHTTDGYSYEYNQPENVIRSVRYTSPNVSVSSMQVTEQVFDGLGRPSAIIRKGASPAGGDLTETFSYDSLGRQTRHSLPIPDTLPAFYGVSEEPYSQTRYDDSPLDLPIEEYGPGKAWHDAGKAVRTQRLVNSFADSLSCLEWTVAWTGDTTLTIGRNDHYLPGLLRAAHMTDEEGNTVIRFTDMRENPVLDRSLLRGDAGGVSRVDTYYLYDDFGRLTAVLPPELSFELENDRRSSWSSASTSAIGQFAYLYRYDSRGRCIAKKLPGCGWTCIVYDRDDRPVFEQRAVQRSGKRWNYIIRDNRGRECLKGEMRNRTLNPFTDPLSVYPVLARRTEDGIYGYTVEGCDINSATVQSVTWWDDYRFLGRWGIPGDEDLRTARTAADGTLPAGGLPTGSLVSVLDVKSGDNTLWTVYYYDGFGREVQTNSQYPGGVEKEVKEYDFTGNVTARSLAHMDGNGLPFMTETYSNGYDSWGRPTTAQHQLGPGGQAVLLRSGRYDAAGRPSGCSRASSAALSDTVRYTVRSLPDSISVGIGGGTFWQTITHDWNGNVRTVAWCNGGNPGPMLLPPAFGFTYDGLSRLKTASFSTRLFSEGYDLSWTYDRHGNITQESETPVSLPGHPSRPLTTSYTMDGNRMVQKTTPRAMPLSSVTDYYAYDASGRMVSDTERGIQKMTYNALDLPMKIQFSADTLSPLYYSYAADGRKLEQGTIVTSHPGGMFTQTDYIPHMSYRGNLVYVDGALDRILVDGGYINAADSTYHFLLADYLGNVRVVASADGAIEKTFDFRPYGDDLNVGQAQDVPSVNPYKFGGKEWDGKLLNYDFHARPFSPSTRRWPVMDSKSEDYYRISPYAYCAANPVNLVDPDGRDIWGLRRSGEIWYIEKDEDYHRLYVFDEDEQMTDKYFSMSNSTVFSALKGDKGVSSYIGGISERQDLFRLFFFLSDNSSSEWAFHYNAKKVVIGTIHNGETAGDWEILGLNEKPSFSIHSHPDIPATPTDEYFSMGMNPVNHSFERINPLPGLDWYNVQHFPQRKAKIYFVYFPNSKNFYRLAYPNKLATKHNLFSKYR